MPAGRPKSFESVKQLQRAADGKVVYLGGKLENNDFRYESDLERYIVANIKKFSAALGGEYIRHSVNVLCIPNVGFGPRGRRVDVLIECKDCIYIVELKNPSSGTESRAAIGQVLDYGREFTDTRKKEMVIVSTMFDIHTARTIKHYNLPIRYFYISKAQMMEFECERKNRQAA